MYKSPGAEWVQQGRMAIPCLLGDLATAEEGFAHYPPLYPGFFAGWYGMFGVGLASSLAGCFAIRFVQAVLVGFVADRWLAGDSQLMRWDRAALVACCVFATWANHAYFDRPEELGMVVVWGGILCWAGRAGTLTARHYAAWGAWGGIAALVAPYCGLISCLILTCRWGVETPFGTPRSTLGSMARRVPLLAGAAACCCGVAGAWVLWTEWRSPGLLADQLLAGNLTYFGGEQRLSWLARLGRLPSTFLFNPPQLPVALVALAFAPFAWRGASGSRVEAATLWLAALVSLGCIALGRPTAYTYLGTSLGLLTPLFAVALARYVHRDQPALWRWVGWSLAVVCVAITARDALRHSVSVLHGPESRRADAVGTRLRAAIPAGDTVATAPRFWLVFQGRNPWRDAFLSARRSDEVVRRCDWLVLDAEIGVPPYLHYFELVERTTDVAGRRSPYDYSLWRRRAELDNDPKRETLTP